MPNSTNTSSAPGHRQSSEHVRLGDESVNEPLNPTRVQRSRSTIDRAAGRPEFVDSTDFTPAGCSATEEAR